MSEQMDGVQNDGGAEQTQPETVTNQPEQKLIKEADHKRALDDLHKWKKQAKDMQSELERIKESMLKEKQDYKTLYETEKSLREKEAKEKEQLKQTVVYSEKFKAATQALTKAGLRPEAMTLLETQPLDELQVDVANGKFIVDGVDTLVDSWKSKFGFAFQSESVKINNGGGASNADKPKELTAAYMVSLETKDPEKYKKLLPEYMKQRAERMKR